MSATKQDLLIEKGATFNLVVTWRDEDNVLVNLTDYTARMQIRETIDSATPIVDLTDGDGITLGGTSGTITITIDDAVTSAIVESIGVYDLELEDDSGFVTRLREGTVEFKGEVTR